MKKIYLLVLILSCFICPRPALAVEIAPRISDREIVERLSRLEEGQKRLEARFDAKFESVDKRFDSVDKRFEAVDKRFDAVDKRFEAVDKRFDDLRSEMKSRFDSVDKRFDGLRSEMNNKFDSVDKRIDLLTWMFGIFITTSIVILGFVIRMQWQMQKNQTRMDTALEIQKGELKFLREMIEKLLPPKGIL